MEVSTRFDKLLSNLTLTDPQKEDGITKHKGVRKTLNEHYYNSSSESANSMLVGSWGKGTRIRPPRDIDLMFVLPHEVYERYYWKTGNKQSQLLQEVKGVLEDAYYSTSMKADGQVILVSFLSYAVEVVPSFKINGEYLICDTNDGGKYKKFDPESEKENISKSNDATNNNTRDLVRMLKRWQSYCSVPMKSFWLELLSIKFLEQWQYKGNSSVFYDWMIRDFFKWLTENPYKYLVVPGTYELVGIGNAWLSKAESAYSRAKKASEYEAAKKPYTAGEEWQKIFGDFIPIG